MNKLDEIKDRWLNSPIESYEKTAVDHIEWLIDRVECYRDFIESIAGGVYDSPRITQENIRSEAIEILSKEIENT